MTLICCSVSSSHRNWTGDSCYYCAALRCIQENIIRWEGSGTRSVPPLFVRHDSHTPKVTCLPWMTIANVNMLSCDKNFPLTVSVFFPPSHQMFPCMGRDTKKFGFWRRGEYLQPHLNSSCSLLKLLENATTSKVQWVGVWGKTPFSTGDSSQFCRIHYIPNSVELGKQLVWASRGIAKPENILWKSPKPSILWCFQWYVMAAKANACSLTEQNKYEMWIEKKSMLKNAETGSCKWEEGSCKLEEGRKAAPQLHPVHFREFCQWQKSEITCWRYQLCAQLSTFNAIFCHNLPLKKNSPGIGPSFSRPSSQEGRGTWLSSTRHFLCLADYNVANCLKKTSC